MPELELLEPQSFTRADWEGLFRSLTADLDPWAFDLVELIGRFRAYVAGRDLEFAVPGRMVLASSVLLRMKSDWVKDGGAPPTVEQAVDEVVAELAAEEPPVYIAPELRLPLRRVPRGRVTVGDLGRALRAALAAERRRTSQELMSPEDLGLEVEREPFTERAIRLLRLLLSLVNGERVIPFGAVARDPDPKEQVARLVELLHLDAEGQVRLSQEEFLGEIMIEIPDGSESPR